eukprot:m.137216 g.137216  ORF g.137216 m.137216 type:complete len:678 (+) comp16047_c0_seq1:270-2303(+)
MAGLDPAATTTVLFSVERDSPEFLKMKATMCSVPADKLLTYTRGLWNLVCKQDVLHLRQVMGMFNEALFAVMHDTAGRSILHYAAYLGSVDCMKLLVSVWPQGLTSRDTDKARGGLPVHYAAWGGRSEMVSYLLSQGNTLQEKDLVGNTPLLYAIFGGHLDLVKHLHSQGSSLAERNTKGHSAIIQAACGGHIPVIEYLLARGSQVDERDNIGNTCLLFAAWGGHLELVQWLLDRGASLTDQSNTGHTVLLSAANSGALHVVKWLLEVAKLDPSSRNRNGDTCLLLAAFGGHCELLKWLLDNNLASLSETNTDGLDPLMSACNGGHLKMVQLLMQLGCQLNFVNSSGYSPLILAACGGHVALVEWLHEQGCSLTDCTNEGDSPLLLACYCGHAKLVEWLLQQGLSLDIRNNAGLSPLISAANGGHPDVLELLIQHEAPMEEVDNEGYTAFLLAVRRGYINSAQRLALYGADLSCRTKNGLDAIALAFEYPTTRAWLEQVKGFTPLHIAVSLGSVQHTKRLLQEGANPFCTTLHQTTPRPIDIALPMRHSPETARVAKLMFVASQPWQPSTNRLFGPKYRQHAVMTMILARKLIAERPDLPILPLEIWHRVVAMIGRRVEHGPAPAISSIMPSPPRPALTLRTPRATQTHAMDEDSETDDLEYVSASMDDESDGETAV